MLLTEECMERQVAFLIDASSEQRKPTLPARFAPLRCVPLRWVAPTGDVAFTELNRLPNVCLLRL